jgi:beta-lactamase regulating signal transducer with metallopeptidase domain
MTPALHAIAQYSALRIVDTLAEGTVIAIFAAALLHLARRQNAGTRFAIWFSALIAIATLPLIATVSSHPDLSARIPHAAITVPDSWALYVFAAWALIAGYFLLGIVRALLHLRALRSSATPVDPASLDPMLQETLRRSTIHRGVVVCTSQKVRVPTALGLSKPAIVIPDWAMQELSAAELNQIFLHELAHLRRWDDWTNLAQQFVRAIFFFHPAVWWIENNASLEREIACDDAVLAETTSPRSYAECLAHLAERSFVQRSVALAQAAIGRIRQTSSRVARILDANRAMSTGHNWKPAVSLVAVFTIVCAVSVSRAPRLIAFEGAQAAQADSASQPQNSNLTPVQEFPRALPVVAAKFTPREAQRKPALHKPTPARYPVILHPKPGRMLHLTSVNVDPVPVTEAVFVFIQGQAQKFSDLPVYQIQMWRVTFVRYVPDAAAIKTPPKKT